MGLLSQRELQLIPNSGIILILMYIKLWYLMGVKYFKLFIFICHFLKLFSNLLYQRSLRARSQIFWLKHSVFLSSVTYLYLKKCVIWKSSQNSHLRLSNGQIQNYSHFIHWLMICTHNERYLTCKFIFVS